MTWLILLIFILLTILWTVHKIGAFRKLNNLHWFTYLIASLESLIMAIQVGVYCWPKFLITPQQYSDFVVGSIGFANQNKSVEFYTLYVTIFSFTIFFILLIILFANASENPKFFDGVNRIAIYGLTPALIMLGQSLRFSSTHFLLLVSSGTTALSVGIIFILLILFRFKLLQPDQARNLGIKFMLIVVFLGMSELGLGIFLRRLGIMSYRRGLITGLCVLIYLISLFLFKKQTQGIERKVNLGVLLSQLGVPLLFAVLFTPPARLLDGTTVILPYKPILLIFLLSLIIGTILDILRRFIRENKRGNSAIQIISPWALLAILIFLQSSKIYWPGIATDEYHYGEFYLPWWLFKQFGYLPYLDYEPARGLVNYVPGFLSWLFYDNSFGAQNLVINQFSAFYVFIAFFTSRWILGDFFAFLMAGSLFYYTGQPTGGIIVAIAALVIFYKSVTSGNPVRALWIWFGLSCIISFFQITECPIFVVATLPIAIWLLIQAFRQSKKNLWLSLGILSVIGIFVFFNKTTNALILSTLHYVLDQGGVNEVAHGIVWQLSENLTERVTSGYFWQLIRFSWLFLLIPTIVLLIRNRFDEATRINRILLMALLLMCLLIIPRAAGRIYADIYSKIGLASIGFVICGLPLVIIPNTHNARLRTVLPLCFAFIFGLIGMQEVQVQTALSIRGQIIEEPALAVSGDDYGFPSLGSKVMMDGNQLTRQIQLKKVIDRILEPQETYYDATNHTLDYGIQGRASPVTNPAPYNTPAFVQQVRVVEQLKQKQIPLALIQAENIFHDGGKLSMRDFTIYEYLIKEYLPFQDEFGRIWMIKRGEESRLSGTEYRIGTENEQLALLTQAFWNRDIQGIPAAWGNSVSGLLKHMSNPRNLLADQNTIEANAMQLLKNDQWEVTGPDPYIVLNFPKDFKCDLIYIETDNNISGNSMTVYWTDNRFPEFSEDQSVYFAANSRKFLIPMSSEPSWMLSDGITSLRIDLPDNYKGDIQLLKVYAYSRPGF
ncbi:hypothetical protein LARV_03625 [Longilinea arvoryzae]|uniref:Uncharacterized protein n=1 Tax=Longilinea arvoryzae TaxID=360412 RepID=A0A0S7BNC7_9CHLR|nr:hypothetical protein [Longilinea arvoryzae]GAP15832.1 hypothetical protein LARV_03625 [Longilinea arvoryzae]